MNKDSKTNKVPAQAQNSRSDTIIVLLCGLAAFIACMTLHFSGANKLVAFNFFIVTVGILLVPVSVLAKNVGLIRAIAVVSLTIALAAAIVNPPWKV